MQRDKLKEYLVKSVEGIDATSLPKGTKLYNGKVRDVVDLGENLLITTSDRISAFDKILSTIPCKGEILNRMALFWFKKTEDIIQNHIIKEVSARTVLVKKCNVLPVEVIVRGYLTGSAWRDYSSGKDVSGIELPKGMKMDQKFKTPLITPSTKAELGEHDMPISGEEIVKQGLVEAKLWAQVEDVALRLFARGTEIASANGLILVDTKYEFGISNGELVIVDEVHTPDSSRFWFSNSYQTQFESQKSQKKVDKEFLREWLMDRGFMGDGEAPVIPDDVKLDVAEKYIQAFETITGTKFRAESLSPDDEIKAILANI